MRKSLLSLLALLPLMAYAYDVKIDGIYYYLSGDEAFVTYQGYEEEEQDGNTVYTYISDYTGDVVIPETVTYEGKTYRVTAIGNHAFRDCSEVTSITIPESVDSIGAYAFRYTNLTAITIPESVTTISGAAFQGCTGLTSIDIPESVDSIAQFAFNYCSSLSSFTIPMGVRSIEYASFRGCAMPSITIPEGVTAMYDGAFQGCNALTSVTIPSTMTYIDAYVFYGCTSLTEVYCHAENIPETKDYTFDGVPFASATLYVPASAIDKYKTTEPWSNFGSIVPLTTPISNVLGDESSMGQSYYDLHGRRIGNRNRGVNIIRYSDGTSKKMLMTKE